MFEAANDTVHGGLGHNNPPSDADIFAEQMREKYPEIIAFAERMLAAEDRLPQEVKDDETSGKLGDFSKQVQTALKNIDATRTSEKEIYLEGGRRVDGFFTKRYLDKLKALKAKAEAINGVYLQKKKDEERRRREEEAEKKRLEAEAALRESERKRHEAEQKRREVEEQDRKAREEAARREAEIKAKADEELRLQRQEIERQTKAREEAEAKVREAKLQKERDDEALRKMQEEAAIAKQAQKEAEERHKEIERQTKAELKEVKQDIAATEDALYELSKQAKQDERESNKLFDAAVRADNQAQKFDKLADSKAADMARVRGDQGSLSTLRTDWVVTVTNRDELDKDAIWPHLKAEDLQIALNSWAKANPGKQMRGAYAREEVSSTTR